jgi:hypothetical protein
VADFDAKDPLPGPAVALLRARVPGANVQVQIAHHALVVQTAATDDTGTTVVGGQVAATPKDKPGAPRLIGLSSASPWTRPGWTPRRGATALPRASSGS